MVTASEEWHGEEALVPGTRFGRYLIGRKVGAGGVGTVYEAIHVELKKKVAIKVLSPWVADEPEVRMRFLREGESASRLRHPNVVDVYDVGSEGDITYMVMEFLEGISLSGLLRKHGRLTPSVIADVLVPISSALHAAHERNVIHRDLKPSNIFLAQSSLGEVSPKLLDFGISKIIDEKDIEGITLTGTVLGTPSYMSPEQAHGGVKVDARSDQYSLGVIAYLCITGHRPFTANSMYQVLHRIVRGDFTPPSEICSDIPAELETVILTAMATDPEARYPTVMDLGRALLQFADARLSNVWSPLFGVHVAEARLTSESSDVSQARELALSFRSQSLTLTPDRTVGQGRRRLWLGGSAMLALLMVVITWVALNYGLRPSSAEKPENENVAVVAATASGEESTDTVDSPLGARTSPSPLGSFRVAIMVEPGSAQLRLDGELAGVGKLEIELPKDGRSHRLEVSAPGFVPQSIEFEDKAPDVSKFYLAPIPPPKDRASSDTGVPQSSNQVQTDVRKKRRELQRKKKLSKKEVRSDGLQTRPKPVPKKGTNNALILK
ncbi:MAG: serine/threonine protein kinase [Myxococcales bacterium]|nr:serine/threonine protein kinase [Myxococcales bacterium]